MTGKQNLITDVAGIKIGNAHDDAVRSGVTVIVPDAPATAAVEARGGAPGSRETDALAAHNLVAAADAVVLSGGSVYGLDAASGVAAWLGARGRGVTLVAGVPPSPVVPAAILFDLNNGGDKGWGEMPPYRALGIAAIEAADMRFALGNEGAGYGAAAGQYKGGLGSASAVLEDGVTIGAIVAVNAFGTAVMPGTSRFWASPLARGDELGKSIDADISGFDPADLMGGTKADAAQAGQNTTIAVIACDACLTPAQAKRVAVMAADGFARALRPVHTTFDGDTVFVLATGRDQPAPEPHILTRIGAMAADVLARAIARGVYEAATLGAMISYRERHRAG